MRRAFPNRDPQSPSVHDVQVEKSELMYNCILNLLYTLQN
jgi:hypothetical protein